jgi:acyl CoA:acetate/3-ketoacid CoA transferase beta subunit
LHTSAHRARVFDRLITDVAVFDFVGSPVRRMRLVEQLTNMPLDDLRACAEAGFDCDEPVGAR